MRTISNGFMVFALLSGSAFSSSGCAGDAKPAESPQAEAIPPAEPPKEAAKQADEKAVQAKADAPKTDAPKEDKPADADKGAPAADSGGASEESTARNVKYVVNPEGMRVELEGVSFAPKAEAVKVAGGYGVKLKIEVKAKDGKTHSLLAPANAEVAFAGSVKRKEGEPEKFGDKREGDREVVVKDKAVHLTRSWPAAGGPKPIANGEELELMVGIWGLGEDAASRRPLKKFCKVTLKFDKDKPKVSVTTPDGVTR